MLFRSTHYLTLSKNESEEIWSIRGELVSIGSAMGLHRDPDKWRMHREVAERRRWAWWHILLLERLVLEDPLTEASGVLKLPIQMAVLPFRTTVIHRQPSF